MLKDLQRKVVQFQDAIPYGYCQCGCGQKTNLAPKNDSKRGWGKGKPLRFINNHHCRGVNNYRWNNGTAKHSDGYVLIMTKHHPRANRDGYVLKHILIAEKALGKYLPPKAQVHHHTKTQLVVCPDMAYHKLLHQRQRAYEACGHADWLKCSYCGQYDDPKNLYIRKNKRQGWHRSCQNSHKQSGRRQ